jgi:hypothetical protein
MTKAVEKQDVENLSFYEEKQLKFTEDEQAKLIPIKTEYSPEHDVSPHAGYLTIRLEIVSETPINSKAIVEHVKDQIAGNQSYEAGSYLGRLAKSEFRFSRPARS